MTTFRFTTGVEYSLAQFTELHNQSFAGYFFPMQITPEVMANFCALQQINLARCVVMHTDQDAFVGLAKLALRGDRAWCGGFGIAPAFRGQGLGKVLMQQMIAAARDAQSRTLWLEVLTQNAAAIRVYEGAGMQRRFQVFGLELEFATLPPMPNDIHIAPVGLHMLIPWLSTLPQQVWQRDLPTLLAQHSAALTLTNAQGHTSATLYVRSPQRITVDTMLLHPQANAEDVAALLQATVAEHPDIPIIQLFDEPEGSRALTFCRELGFREIFSQHVMELALT